MTYFVEIALVLGNVILLALSLKVLKEIFKLRSLSEMAPLPDERLPSVSVVLAARNEETHIEEALRRMCQFDYPNLEIIVVDDRSDDGTAKIIEAISIGHPQVKSVTIRDLPEGWLGKAHALHQGMLRATGDWVMITDSDVNFRPDAVRLGMSWVLSKSHDFLAVLPDLVSPSFWVSVTAWTFGAHLLCWIDADKLADPQSPTYFGVGGYNLMRRSTYDQTTGFAGLRLDASEDVGIARLFKEVGARIGLASGGAVVHTAWYDSMHDLLRGFEHTSLGIAGYRIRWVLLLATFMLLLGGAPLGAALYYKTPSVAAVGVTAYAAGLVVAICARRLLSVPAPAILLAPVGHLILFWVFLRAGMLGWWRGGLKWRDTFYSFRELRGVDAR
jgi:glycosyltransferase involved in cell wall biosynthesis